MSSQENNNNILAIATQLQNLEDSSLPARLRPSSNELALTKARQGYYARVESETSYVELVKAYNVSARSEPAGTCASTIAGSPQLNQALIPALIPQRDSLVEHRERHGLDKLKEMLVTEIVRAASFEAGLDFLAEHIDHHPNVLELLQFKSKQGLSPQEKVELAYPDLNADEVSWLALVMDFSRVEHPWIGDVPHLTLYPPSLVSMDPSGLVFSHNIQDADDHGRISPRTAEEVSGVTGNDRSVFHYPFRHNVAEGIKALIMLSLNEGDIFKQLKDTEAIMAMRQGDSLLLRSFLRSHASQYGLTPDDLKLQIADIVNASSNPFTKANLDTLRDTIAQYLRTCDFLDTQGHPQLIPEVVKVLGMLERAPCFVEERTPFKGVAVFYAGQVQFFGLDGTLVDSVPIVEHLRNQFGYKLADSAGDISLRAETTRAVFRELDQRIQETNIDRDNKMQLDRLQEELLIKHRITAPIRATWQLEEATSSASYFMKGSASSKYLRRFLKFGASELRDINSLFSSIPSVFTSDVRMLRKGSISLHTESILATGNMMEGCYLKADRSVCINVPETGPLDSRSYSMRVLVEQADPKGNNKALNRWLEDEGTIVKIKHNFLHTLVHELAESVVATTGSDLITLWAAIESVASDAEKMDKRKLHVSTYATTSPKEDFCESCAVYCLAGGSFRKLAQTSGVLARKYEFLKKLFSSDGTTREFQDRYSHHVYDVIGDPSLPWEQIAQDHFAVRFQEMEEMAERDRRDRLTDQLISYEEVATVISQHEARGQEISREDAAQIAFAAQREQNSERDHLAQLHRIYLFVSDQVTCETQQHQVSNAHLFDKIFEVFDALYSGDIKALRTLLIKTDDKRLSTRSAQEIINRLQPLVKAHSQLLDEYRARYMEGADETADERAIQIMSAIGNDLLRDG